MSKAPFDFVMDDVYATLGNPAVLIDTSYNLLALTENPADDDPLWNELVQLGRFSHESVDFFNRAHFIQAYADSDVVSLMTHESLKYDRACGKIFDADGVQIGDVVVVACARPFEAKDFEKLEKVCETIGFRLGMERTPPIKARVFEEPSLVSRLLEGGFGSDDLALADAYNALKENLFVIVADISRYEPTLSHLAYFRDVFERMRGDFHYSVFMNNVVILASAEEPVLFARQLDPLTDFFRRYGILAGISSAFQNLLDARKYYRQAMEALNYGAVCGRARTVFRYDEFRILSILNSMKDVMDIEQAINPVVTMTREYDKRHSTAYYDTLCAYMLNGRNKNKTAALLNLSPAELDSRLEQIERLFETDWDNGDMLLSIGISQRVYDFIAFNR